MGTLIDVQHAIGKTTLVCECAGKFALHGGGKRIRTADLLIANETLYQLSYTPKPLIFKELRGF